MTNQDKTLKKEAQALKPIVQIGKNGLTPTSIEQVSRALKKHKLIKVKFLKSALENKDKKEIARELAQFTESKIIYATGFVVALYKR